MKREETGPIDFVVLWVDDSDPDWRREKARHQQGVARESCGEKRYRDWELLRWQFRAFEKFTPWVNHIYLVTCGHAPNWLDLRHPKVSLVRHDEFMPAEYLPTFSANPIELNLHRIPGLSENFVYFNDDCIPIRPLSEEAFFRHALPRDIFVQSLLTPDDNDVVFSGIQFNSLGVTAKYFDKRNFLRRHLGKYLAPCYGKYFFRNLYLLPVGKLTGFRSLHSASSLRKCTLCTLWEQEPELLHQTCLRKFRSGQDVNQYIFAQHQIMSGAFEPIAPGRRPYFVIGRDRERYAETIRKQKADIVCLNDVLDVDFSREKEYLDVCFEQILPGKSGFERE